MFITALFTIIGHGSNLRSIDRGMDKEDLIYIHNGILLSHKTE